MKGEEQTDCSEFPTCPENESAPTTAVRPTIKQPTNGARISHYSKGLFHS